MINDLRANAQKEKMTPSRKPRLTLSLDDDALDLLARLQAFTGLSPAQTIQKLFPAHLEELNEYLTWLEQLPPGPSLQRTVGPHLLQSYGPETLTQSIKNIDPNHVTEAEKLALNLKGA